MTIAEGLAPLIAEHPFFHGMSPSQIETVTGCAVNTRFGADEYLCREGDEALWFYILRHGTVAIETHVPQHGPVVLQTVGAGEILGWSWLLPPYRWRFSARANELVRAVALNGACLRAKCEADHELGYELLKRFAEIVAQRLTAARMQLLDLYAANPPRRP